MKPQGISIVICCYNGAHRLPETIRHIACQRVPPYLHWELLIVDNGSTDDSAVVARREWGKYHVDTYMRIVREPIPGLSHARARGFNEARYEYVVLCDDDNWLDEHYVNMVYQILSENGNIGALGGMGKVVCEVESPTPELSYIFAAGAQAPASGRVSENKLYGAGCAIRHSAYTKLLRTGFKSLLTDRRGAELSSGGDHELCLALAITGWEIWYDDRLRFTHFITRERLSWSYFERYAVESSRCFNVITSYKLIAANNTIRQRPWLIMFRNFMVCAWIFFGISLKYMLARQDRVLQFKYLHFSYKLRSYFRNFREMVETHERIVSFQQSCRVGGQNAAPSATKAYKSVFNLSFSLKPSRQLQ